jgi:putative resolvase
LYPGDGVKLSKWAKQQGIDYKTAYRWFRAGILPVASRQLPTGTILVDPPASPVEGAVLYARVSSADQKTDLDRQLARLVTFAGQTGLHVTGTVVEIGSGLNGKRPKLLRVLADGTIGVIVVEHRDRLARFGSEYIEAVLLASGRKLVVVDKSEMKDDLVQDMIDVLTSFCARLYGRRSARNKALKAVEATK